MKTKHLAKSFAAASIILGLSVLALAVGDVRLTASQVGSGLLGQGTIETLVVQQLRLPRVLVGIGVGALLGVSGAVMQSVAYNKLASPDLIGVNSGAAVGAVAAITVFQASTAGVALSALGGGLATALFILPATQKRGLDLLLIGVGISAMLSGNVSLLLVRADIDDAATAHVWLTGSLSRASYEWALLGFITLIGVVMSGVFYAWRLDALVLGHDVAKALGHEMKTLTTALYVIAVISASVAVALAGPIGFIALVAPHLAQMLWSGCRPGLLSSALVGIIIVLGSDILARTLFMPILLPTGAVTAVLGAPFLLWLLVRKRIQK